MNSPQLPLSFRYPAHQRFSEYIAGDNGVAVAAVERLVADHEAPWVFLSGPEGSGKTHLLIAACQAATTRHAQYLPLRGLGAHAESALLATQDIDLLAIDDVQAIAGDRGAEIALFDLFNRARAAGASLLFAARQGPGLLPVSLPDLTSRLSSCSRLSLKPLEERERRDVLKARAAARGFELDDEVLDFLFRRHARDLGALLELLDKLDRESLAAQRRVTVPFLRRVMGLPSRGP